MGKHNGKARRAGLSVGSALVNRARRDGRTGSAAAYLHTTDTTEKGPNMQSVIERNDLDEMMAMVRPPPAAACHRHRHRRPLPPARALNPCALPRPAPPLQADLAGKDFSAEKQHVIVISTGAVDSVDAERLAAERAEAEERNRHRWGCGGVRCGGFNEQSAILWMIVLGWQSSGVGGWLGLPPPPPL